MGREILINVHSIIPCSRVNGPGKRLVVFFQGCIRKCLGCFNPGTHSFKKNQLFSAEDIFQNFLQPDIEGVTVSGGEPFLQAKGLLQLLKTAKEEYGLSTVVYTGFSHEDLLHLTPRTLDPSNPSSVFNHIDVLIDGPYKDEMKEPTLLARGSANQRFLFFSDRYQEEDFYMPAKVEIIISKDGTIKETGFSRICHSRSLSSGI